MARAAFEAALALRARSARAFGKPIFEHQAVQLPARRHGHADRGGAPAGAGTPRA
ncbi:MAG: hypothetical protein MZW92_04985 [Comamonadaceae bacterium]|nr:hypothetical protein [Comamonadaceae bacterium]